MSGSNNVPIGTRQSSSASSVGEGRYPPAPAPPTGGFDQVFPDSGLSRRARSRGRGSGRGGNDFGASTGYRDSYRPDNGPDTESGRYGSPPPERNVSPSYSRPKDHYEETQPRFEREPAPHRRYPESETYPLPAPPPLSRQSSQTTPVPWDYSESRHERPERYSRREDGPPSADGAKPERERYPSIDEPRRSLEDRITLAPTSSNHHSHSQSPQESRPPHPLPLNPSLRRDTYSPDEPRQSTSHGHPEPFHGHQPLEGERRGSFRKERDAHAPPHSDNLVDRVGGYDDAVSGRSSRTGRGRRPDPSLDNGPALPVDAPSASSSHHRAPEDMSEHGQRPAGLHRNASLLERMAVGGDGGADGKAKAGGNFDDPPSLRDRVQIPSKRDWDDMGGPVGSSPNAYGGGREPYFEGEEESAAKRRRKSGKPKRGRRGRI
ncbi:hypothetical protein K438DRAFT_1795544, partial [Mycena galopus ATCC 62051]